MALLSLSERLAERTARRDERRVAFADAVSNMSPAQEDAILQLLKALHERRAAERAAGGNVLSLQRPPAAHE